MESKRLTTLNTNNRVMATIAQNCTLAAKCMAAKTCARAVSNTNSDEFTPEMCYRKKTEDGEFIQVNCPDHFELELWQQWQDTKDKIQHLFSCLANKLSCSSL